jgi:hypothetical protein
MRRRWTAGLVAIGLLAAACGDDSSDRGGEGATADDHGFRLEVVSSPPQYVTGGDALVAVVAGDSGADLTDVEVTVGDDDVSNAFALDPDDDGRTVGVIDGLADGDTELTARADGEVATLVVTNHPSGGPLFAGEQLPLAACTTEIYGLEASTPDDGCFAPTEVAWQYVDDDGELHNLDDPTAPPDDVEMVELEDGTEAPFVVRTETGVLNRSVYRISVLEPGADPDDPLTPDTSAWNGRLVYQFGGGCGVTFTQGYIGLGGTPLETLRRGYATASATFNTFQVTCNDMISAETASMVKERFVIGYGEPVHTIGEGGSGGAIQQILLVQNQPGLLDGITPSVPFPDALSIAPGVYDCGLLTDYYASPEGEGLTEEQRRAINGHAVAGTCDMWDATFAQSLNPVTGCEFDVAAAFGAGGGTGGAPTIAPDEIYDAENNPGGWRCTVWESNVAVTGTDEETGFARSGYDNQGVQYGLDALNAGAISVDEFLDLNGGIGGYDFDGEHQAERSVVPDELAERAYATGRVSGPYGGLTDTPIILVDIYTDETGDIHDRVRAFSIADRLAGGTSDGGDWPGNLALWSIDPGATDLMESLTGAVGEDAAAATFAMDEWLTAAAEYQDAEGGSWGDAVTAARPEAAESRCVLADADDPIVGRDAHEQAACAEALTIAEEPRMAAGAPRAGDIIKCQRIPVDEAVDAGFYEVELTDDEVTRLADIFPDGVCDFSRPGIGQAPPTGEWPTL